MQMLGVTTEEFSAAYHAYLTGKSDNTKK
jgi:hypothetical protein